MGTRRCAVWVMPERAEGAAKIAEPAPGSDRASQRAALGEATLGQHVLDPSPTRARGAYLPATSEAAPQPREPRVHHTDPGEGVPVERRVAFGAERGDPEDDRDRARELPDERDALVDVPVRLLGQADHEVELESLEPVAPRTFGDREVMALITAAVDQLAQPLARAIERGGESLVSGALERLDELLLEPIRTEAAQADLDAPIRERVDEVDDAGMVGDGGPDEAHLARLRRDRVEHPLLRDHPHSAIAAPPHHAVGAAPRTPPLGLD